MQTIEWSSVVRRLPLASVCALVTLAGPVLAQKVDRPEISVGDQWRFATGYVAPSTPNRTWVVTGVTAAGIAGTEDGQPLTLTSELNVVDSPRATSSASQQLSFPLEVGKQWSYATDFLLKDSGMKGRSESSVTVVGYEKVRVAAGEFDAFKLEQKANFSGVIRRDQQIGSLLTGVSTMTYWYAPAARAVVKSEYRDLYVKRVITELFDFKLQP
jgi:hypothetical protein